MSEMIPYLKPVVIVDVETTGGSPGANRLIEIGIIRIENGKEVSRYESLINPSQPVPPFVQNLTGISNRDLETAPATYSSKNAFSFVAAISTVIASPPCINLPA